MSSSPSTSMPILMTPLPTSSVPQISNILGPFFINSSVTCFNSSLLPGWNRSKFPHPQLQQAVVQCPNKMDSDLMVDSLVHFWNVAFTFMIITAVGGNTAVLWIVIRRFSGIVLNFLILVPLQITEGWGPSPTCSYSTSASQTSSTHSSIVPSTLSSWRISKRAIKV